MAVIGFIGLGHMGGPMSANLVAAGHVVRGFDLASAALEAARANGVTVVGSAVEAVTGAEAVITMLPGGKHLLDCYEQVLPAVEPGALLVDSSTVDVADARAAHALAGTAGFGSLDAPVSGGTAGAEAGTLTFMVGGAEEHFQRAEPLLAPMARKVIHCGGPGNGQVTKMCNNLVLGASMIAVGEAFVLGERLGLSNQALYDVASISTGQCWALTTNCPVPGLVETSRADHDYEPGFSAALMLKDLKLAESAAEQSGTDAAIGRLATELYQRFNEEGGGGYDFGAIIRSIRERSAAAERAENPSTEVTGTS
ncbi:MULTISPECIES: 3-hydroxyisobutyrate dehydrogenase [unclassified Saccharopolyspora]|uniref:3-hydroxyisobutyrate dehydrogenase n=1 Tax=unclassified Saccharopolyspora TaxID=2646250 RepID=UPI001CD4C4EF|nr:MULTISPECIES: 3-hydroxyisobutyrate dehydrogenase [unclassified Saccharopolyspora]MCA1196069.1 3-hydroxyisobutyrate dehydrogenase [Saccharopolyspora sp. 6V]MCA1229611.1 3-hydroxyisobutyrate dehydrogenase [Saccharopolyspora sp. 6M]